MTRLRILHLMHRFGMTEAQASAFCALIWGAGT